MTNVAVAKTVNVLLATANVVCAIMTRAKAVMEHVVILLMALWFST